MKFGDRMDIGGLHFIFPFFGISVRVLSCVVVNEMDVFDVFFELGEDRWVCFPVDGRHCECLYYV